MRSHGETLYEKKARPCFLGVLFIPVTFAYYICNDINSLSQVFDMIIYNVNGLCITM